MSLSWRISSGAGATHSNFYGSTAGWIYKNLYSPLSTPTRLSSYCTEFSVLLLTKMSKSKEKATRVRKRTQKPRVLKQNPLAATGKNSPARSYNIVLPTLLLIAHQNIGRVSPRLLVHRITPDQLRDFDDIATDLLIDSVRWLSTCSNNHS